MDADGGRGPERGVCIALLGRFEVRVDGRIGIDNAWPRRKAQALLKLIALQPERQLHRERVVEALWPNQNESSASNNLHKTVHHLRTAFVASGAPRDLLRVSGNAVVLADDAWIDVHAFRAAGRSARANGAATSLYEIALELYSGDLLSEDAYDEWAAPSRDELRNLRDLLLIEASAIYARNGDFERAIERLQTLLQHDPLHEEAHRGLMRLYERAGRREQTVRQYQRLREALQRELDVEPSEETESLYRSIVARREPTGASGPATVPLPMTAPATTQRERAGGREPQVRFCAAPDGSSIAYWVTGDGPPLVIMPDLPFSHVGLEWRHPPLRELYERLALTHSVVRYDGRGSGLSERHISSFSADRFADDLEAVISALRLEAPSVLAPNQAGPVAITTAASRPGRIGRLILWCSYMKAEEYALSPDVSAVRGLLRGDWALYTQTWAHMRTGWAEGAIARETAEMLRACVEAPVAEAMYDVLDGLDAAADAPMVRVPTLILHRRNVQAPAASCAHRLARAIPGALLLIVEGGSPEMSAGDITPMVEAIHDFTRAAPPSPPDGGESPRALKTR